MIRRVMLVQSIQTKLVLFDIEILMHTKCKLTNKSDQINLHFTESILMNDTAKLMRIATHRRTLKLMMPILIRIIHLLHVHLHHYVPVLRPVNLMILKWRISKVVIQMMMEKMMVEVNCVVL